MPHRAPREQSSLPFLHRRAGAAARAVALGLGLAACHSRPTPPGGDVASMLTVKSLDGQPFDPGVLRGRPALVTFWRPGCPYCAAALPKDQAAARRAGGVAVAVMVSGGNAEATAELKQLGWDGPAVIDSAQLVQRFSIEHVPMTYVLRPDGTADKVFDGDEASEAELADALASAH